MIKIHFHILISFVLFSSLTLAQQTVVDSLACQYRVTENDKERIDKMRYVYAEPHFFRAYNSEKEYVSFQLGNRRITGVFLYLKIDTPNVCIHKDYKITFTFANKKKRKMKNNHNVNCDGIFVRQFTPGDLRALRKNQLASFTVQTYEKNYEFHVNDTIAKQIQKGLTCLTEYKF